MSRHRDNPVPAKPDAKTREVFNKLVEQGYEPSLLSYGTVTRIIIKKGSRRNRLTEATWTRLKAEGRDTN